MPDPCDLCKRVHPGECEPGDPRSVKFCVTLPAGVGRLLTERIPWGDRSSFVAGLIARELGGSDPIPLRHVDPRSFS